MALSSVSYGARLQIPTSVKDFGVQGDGRTDDTLAIRSALASGKRLVFPPGTYLITDTLALPDKCNITLSPKTTIHYSSKVPSRSAFTIKNVSDVHIEGENGTLEGDGREHPHGTHIGIMILGSSSKVLIDHLTVRDFPDDTGFGGNYGDGVYIGGPLKDGTSPSYVTIEKCKCLHNGRVQMGSASGTHITFDHNFLSGSNLAGIDIEPNNSNEANNDIKILDNEIEGSRAGISLIKNSAHVTVEGNHISLPSDAPREPGFANDYEGIHIDTTSDSVVVKDNTIHGGYTGISAFSGKPTITGNTVTASRRGLWIRFDGVQADHNKFVDCWEQGIRIQGNDAKVTDNIVQDCGDQTKLFNAKVSEAIAIEVIDGYKNGVLLRNTVRDTHPHGESRRVVRLAAPDKGGSTWQADIKP